MKLAIVLLFIYSALLEADPQQDWYKTQLNTHILPPYSMANSILQTRIINELVSVNVALLNDASTTQLANRLLCAARDARTSLDQSVAASDQLRNQINEKVTGSVTQVGTYEESIDNKTLEIQQTDQSLIGALAALASAQQAVRDKEASVQAAQHAVNTAEDAVEKARKCHGLLGKRSDTDMPITSRGWFSSITRPIVRPIENAIKDVIIKPVCSAINTGPLNEAKNRRDGAYAELQRARDQVVHYTQLVANHQAQKTNLDAQLVQLHSNLKAVQAALEILRDELKVTISIDTQLKAAGAQLSSVHAGSVALQSAVTNMIDFDQLLTPLNAIYTAMEKVIAMDTTMYVSPAQIQQAKVHLAQIAILVPNIPFNMNTDLVCA